jgi:lipopolysaccharide export system permease protein
MILQRYILREVFKAFLLIATVLFTIITLTGPFLKFYKEYQVVGAGFLADVIPYFIPQAAGYIIPLSILIAGVFIFGRFSEDNEITVIRYSGISLIRVLWPLAVLGLAISFFLLSLNVYVIPRALAATGVLSVNTIKNSIMSPSLINRTIKLPGGYQIYYNDIKDNILSGVSVIQVNKNGVAYQHIKAQEGKIDFFEDTSQLSLTLKKVTEVTWDEKTNEPQVLPAPESLNSILDLSSILIPKRKNLPAMTQKELNKMIRNKETDRFRLSEIIMEKSRRYSFSFAPLLFLLIGVPVGMFVNKGSKVAGLGISALIVFLGYYPITILFTYLGNHNVLNPYWASWIPSMILAVIVVVLSYFALKK